MTTKDQLKAVSEMINAAYRTLQAAEKFVEEDSTEPIWTVYQTISCLSSTLWSLARLVENQNIEKHESVQ